MNNYYIGVDVGTGSVRAALMNSIGCIEKVSVFPIKTWNPLTDHYEQSSEDIWSACCKTVKDCVTDLNPECIKGIGFDATCSLVAIGKDGQPITVSTSGDDNRNIILWMDHRAEDEAKFINNTQHPILQYVGGKISLEMEIPKLLWLKKNLKKCWDNVELFFDLPDYLTWKATDSESRSLCSLVCKWTYGNTERKSGWHEDFFQNISLGELLKNDCKKIGNVVLPPGARCGSGITPKAAKELGLVPGTAVATSIIDAHAGGLGMIGCSAKNIPSDFETRLGLICGTSSCHMIVNPKPSFVPGVWGPYYNVMVPQMWLNEAGQSATGKLIDHIIQTHPAYANIRSKLGNNEHIQQYLSNLLSKMAEKEEIKNVNTLTKDLYVYPDFHGNRSPLADPQMKGMIIGLTLSKSEEDLAVLYLATIQALAYGTKHIMETLMTHGHSKIESIPMCGGLARNPLFNQIHADVLNKPVLIPAEEESVLLGSAILAAAASGNFPSVQSAISTLAGEAQVIHPNPTLSEFHNRRYQVFLKMIEFQNKLKQC